ncbi:hypothetical protein BDV59DRAFT_189538 [Aspergillus ambiguus]|uniref:NADPH oxidase family protein n=1 Tax=Aspergillus ambiguus TaxID=176160 RepID=UPI003CCCC3C5
MVHRFQGQDTPIPIKLSIHLTRDLDPYPGQTVYITPKTGPLWLFRQAHPFSIAWWEDQKGKEAPHRPLDEQARSDLRFFQGEAESAAEQTDEVTEGSTIWLLIQPQAGATGDISGLDNGSKIKTFVDGPYGGHRGLRKYGHVILFAQGIGIAAQMAYVRSFFYGSLRGEMCARRITLVWETRDSKDMTSVRSHKQRRLTGS